MVSNSFAFAVDCCDRAASLLATTSAISGEGVLWRSLPSSIGTRWSITRRRRRETRVPHECRAPPSR